MTNSFRSHNFHLVWSTKNRKDLLLPKVQERLFPYMKGVASGLKTHLLEIGGTANHVHLLLRLGNLDNYSTVVRNLKTSSSSLLKREFPECHDFGWHDGYGSFCVWYLSWIL
jgi:putative transposase